jgi:hypothetical protein
VSVHTVALESQCQSSLSRFDIGQNTVAVDHTGAEVDLVIADRELAAIVDTGFTSIVGGVVHAIAVVFPAEVVRERAVELTIPLEVGEADGAVAVFGVAVVERGLGVQGHVVLTATGVEVLTVTANELGASVLHSDVDVAVARHRDGESLAGQTVVERLVIFVQRGGAAFDVDVAVAVGDADAARREVRGAVERGVRIGASDISVVGVWVVGIAAARQGHSESEKAKEAHHDLELWVGVAATACPI